MSVILITIKIAWGGDYKYLKILCIEKSLRAKPSEARRARRASLASQGEGAPVQCIGFWTSDISKNMHFRHMVHRCLFCLFSPKYQKYIIKKSDPARPDPTITLFARQYLGKYWSYEKYLSAIKVRYMS